jgi:hypothetical protein
MRVLRTAKRSNGVYLNHSVLGVVSIRKQEKTMIRKKFYGSPDKNRTELRRL